MKFDHELKRQKWKAFRKKRFRTEINERKSEKRASSDVDEKILKELLIAEMFAEYKSKYHTHPTSEAEVKEEGGREIPNKSINKENCQFSSTCSDLDSISHDDDSAGFTSTSGSTISSGTIKYFEGIGPALSLIDNMLNGVKTCFGIALDESDLEYDCNASIISQTSDQSGLQDDGH